MTPAPRSSPAPYAVPVSSFASDNYAPAHPDVLAALVSANIGPAPAYGADPWTRQLEEVATSVFGPRASIMPVLTGTAANVISLMQAVPRWGGVVTSRWAHINGDENGAPERVGGLKLLPVDAPNGKLGPDAVTTFVGDIGDVHRAQPTAISLTQSTEFGTVYTLAELQAVADAAHAAGMAVHMDGSRLANAAAFLGCGLRELTDAVGVDLLSFGGTKNGALFGEAVVLFDRDPVEAAYLRKMTMQSVSKQRYVSAQLVALLGEPGDPDPLWLRNARHANAMATTLRAAVDEIDGIHATQATEANAVFAVLPREAAQTVRQQYGFYDWADGPTPDTVEVRWMCAWDTTTDDVTAFASALRDAVRS